MRALFRVTLLTIASCAVCACSEPSRVESTGFRPLAADLTSQPEPPLPEAAFETGPDGKRTDAAREAERRWHDDMILWGRTGWKQIDRLCRAARTSLPDLPVQCPAPRDGDE